MTRDPAPTGPRVTREELLANTSKVLERERGQRLVVLDDDGSPMAIVYTPTDELPLVFGT